jgi:pyridinium-3,5-biscarboxylic acid mononucleotide synthase
MDRDELKKLLQEVRRGSLGVAGALGRLKNWPTEQLPFAAIDHHRGLRQGQAEVIFCQGKTPGQVVAITGRLLDAGANVLATRATPEVYAAVRAAVPRARYNEAGRVITVTRRPPQPTRGSVLVMTAGTADIPVAEEAVETLRALGSRVVTAYDAGVAGLHRVLRHGSQMRRARVIVVVAGMEGALASVIGGLTDRPLVAVPTSVGYGAGAGGIAPLLTMLNSCAAGVGVVNIDNGFGAAVLAHRINLLGERGR